MTVPRIRLGAYGNGTFGLKASTPGNDVSVLVDDNDANKRSFNSQWAGLASIAQVGIALSNGAFVPHTLGYAAYFESRIYDPTFNIVYDDYCAQSGYISENFSTANMTSSGLQLSTPGGTYHQMYVIFRLPI